MRALLLLAATGCATDLATTDSTSALDHSGTAITVVGDGAWGRRLSCPSPAPSTCIVERNIWVDVSVRNDAYDKRVGIVWIDTVREPVTNPWHTAYGSYEHSLDAPYEQWGIDLTAGAFSAIEPTPSIRYAAFVEMNGHRYWDNNAGADYVVE